MTSYIQKNDRRTHLYSTIIQRDGNRLLTEMLAEPSGAMRVQCLVEHVDRKSWASNSNESNENESSDSN